MPFQSNEVPTRTPPCTRIVCPSWKPRALDAAVAPFAVTETLTPDRIGDCSQHRLLLRHRLEDGALAHAGRRIVHRSFVVVVPAVTKRNRAGILPALQGVANARDHRMHG